MAVVHSETPTVGLGRFIKENRFEVPNHQRDYSWTKEYVAAFLKDIEDAKKNHSEIYFCGLMVFTRMPSQALRVLDGQQRLATTLMIFSAIRNWLHNFSDYAKQEIQIETQLLQTDDIGASRVEPKLTLTAANNEYFQRFVIARLPQREIEKSLDDQQPEDRNRTLLKAALQVSKYIETKAKSFSTTDAARDYFVDLIKFLSDSVQVVRFILTSDDAAYTIFETLNDRGLELAPLDLVKNYLFSRAERHRIGSLRDLEGRWAEMMVLLGSVKVDSFLRTFWAARHGIMEGPKLFAAFKNTYDTPEKSHDISIEMRHGAEQYAALFSSKDVAWAEMSDGARQSVDAIETIGSSQMHPMILAAMSRFDKNELRRLLRLLEVIAARYQLVYRGRPGRIESLGGRAAREIWEKKITTASEVLSVLKELYVPDEEFKQRFRVKTESESKKARYIFTVLEQQSLQRQGGTYKNELIPGNVTIEHIFPKTPQADWQEETRADAKLGGMTNRLGNMCLLTDVNRALGNKSWADKAEAFKKSRLRMTNTIDQEQYPIWNSGAIEKRQGYMADLAVAAWRFE